MDMALLSVIRRWHFREHLSIRAIARRTGLSRNTIRKYLRSETVEAPPPTTTTTTTTRATRAAAGAATAGAGVARDGLGAERGRAFADAKAAPGACRICAGRLWWRRAGTGEEPTCTTCHPPPPGLAVQPVTT